MSNRRKLRRPLRESATATAEATRIIEATGGNLSPAGQPRRYRARLIEGDRWGSSGYYPRAVLERDGPKVWPAGTLMYLDHPTPTEEAERPERSVRDLAARIATTPVYERDGLYADIEVFPHAAPIVEALADTIGLSVRGEGTGSFGEIAGRQGIVIESLTRGDSVDFVTKAGAGGKLVSLLEAARQKISEARSIGVWIESRLHLDLTQLADDMYGQGRLTRPERITLSNAIGDALQAWTARVQADAPQLFARDLYDDPEDATTDVSEAARRLREASVENTRNRLRDALTDAYGGDSGSMESSYLWVRDFDPDKGLVWFDANDGTDCDTWQQAYSVADDGTITLTGERVEVMPRTVYDPVPADGPGDVTESANPPTPVPAAVPVSESNVTAGTPPAAPNPATERSAAVTAPNQPGVAPGTAGQVVLGEAERLSQLLAESRTALAEANARADRAEQRATEAERRATVVEAQRDAERRTIARLRTSDLKEASWPNVVARVCDSLTVNEAGRVDEAALGTAIDAEIQAERTNVARLLESYGVGTVKGLGGGSGEQSLSESDLEAGLSDVFQSIGFSEADAKLAAKGR